MAKGKKGKKAKAPPAAKKSAAPKAAVASKAAASEPTVDKKGVVKLGDVKLGRIEKKRQGWGWWAVDGKSESPGWLKSAVLAMRGLVAWARKDGPLAEKKPEPPKAAAAKSKANGAKPAPEPVERPKTWPVMANGKPLPAPKTLTEQEMTEQLAEAQSKLGANIQLDYGMEIARRKREGDIIVAIRPHGFEFAVDEKDAKAAGFEKRKQLFGSLSSVAMWAEKRMVSGNDFFNLAKHNCTEVRDEDGRIIDRKGGIARRN